MLPELHADSGRPRSFLPIDLETSDERVASVGVIPSAGLPIGGPTMGRALNCGYPLSASASRPHLKPIAPEPSGHGVPAWRCRLKGGNNVSIADFEELGCIGDTRGGRSGLDASSDCGVDHLPRGHVQMQRILSRVPKTHGVSSVVGDQTAPCLKFLCAKPLEQASSYVF
jgi:hypothetical protein